MDHYFWITQFKALYEAALGKYAAGNRNADQFFTEAERESLANIGCTPMEVYDLVEDGDDIPFETALLITSARRDYFLTVQNGRHAPKRLDIADFPPKSAELDGIRWLPRAILKAQAKLQGTMPRDLMYCCGGDRQFFRNWNIHPADFLRLVWAVEGEPRKVIEYVRCPR